MGYFLVLLAGAYLLGSIPTGLLVSRVMKGPDPRQAGSGNIGAANLYRLLGRNAGAFTLFGDTLKGALPVFLARFGVMAVVGTWQDWAVASVGLAAVLGHIYPLYLRFRGGKGIATALGVTATLSPLAALLLVAVFALVLRKYRVVSAGSLAGAWLLPLAMGLFSDSKPYLLLAGILSVLILICHRQNIVRLVQGEEPRLGP